MSKEYSQERAEKREDLPADAENAENKNDPKQSGTADEAPQRFTDWASI